MTGGDHGAAGDLPITPLLTIPESELDVTFQTSGGPGGQHANRSATGVALSWDFVASATLSPSQRELLEARLGSRARGGSIRVIADNSRSQWRNRARARAQLAGIVREALVVAPPRRPTKPTRAVRRRRLDAKRRRGEAKELRRRPDLD